MTTDNRTCTELLSEIETLRLRLEEAEDTLHAIQSGEVDALVISRLGGEQVFTLQGAEHPYRVLVETMSEGAAFLTADGHVVYGNKQLANLLQVPIEKLISSSLLDYVAYQDQALFTNLLKFTNQLKKININSNRSEITLTTGTGNKLPVILSFSVINLDDNPGVGVVVTDISERKKVEEISKASYQYARSLLEASLDPLMTVSVDGKIMDVNQATITVTGIERDQLIGSDVLPDTIDDEWIKDEAELNERSNSYMSERKAAEDAFSIKCPRTLYPEANLWGCCSSVLSRRDIINTLSVPW